MAITTSLVGNTENIDGLKRHLNVLEKRWGNSILIDTVWDGLMTAIDETIPVATHGLWRHGLGLDVMPNRVGFRNGLHQFLPYNVIPRNILLDATISVSQAPTSVITNDTLDGELRGDDIMKRLLQCWDEERRYAASLKKPGFTGYYGLGVYDDLVHNFARALIEVCGFHLSPSSEILTSPGDGVKSMKLTFWHRDDIRVDFRYCFPVTASIMRALKSYLESQPGKHDLQDIYKKLFV